jgi:hypothetical protein
MLIHYSRPYEDEMLVEIDKVTAIIDHKQNRVKTEQTKAILKTQLI